MSQTPPPPAPGPTPDPGAPSVPGAPPGAAAPRPTAASRGRRWPTVLLAVVVLLAVLVLVASRIELNEYAISPGQTEDVSGLIHVPPGRVAQASAAHGTRPAPRAGRGTILLTDVYLGQVSLLELLPDWVSHDTQLVPADEVLDPDTSPSELVAQGFLEMQQSQDAARAAALHRLGYKVTARAAGAQIGAVASGSPADRAGLAVGDVVVSAEGTPTPTTCAFVRALHPLGPGAVAHLRVRPLTFASSGAPRYGAARTEAVRLAPAPRGAVASGCPGVHGPNRAVLGVEVATDVAYGFPFHVALENSGIGGPSAGLAMTLGIMDQLLGGHLAKGTVAATGTIDATGQVGAVGGVPQKTVAVERGGASVFMVPAGTNPDNFAEAESQATPSLHVCRVSTLGQALGVLAHFGGHVPASLHPVPVGPRTCT